MVIEPQHILLIPQSYLIARLISYIFKTIKHYVHLDVTFQMNITFDFIYTELDIHLGQGIPHCFNTCVFMYS